MEALIKLKKSFHEKIDRLDDVDLYTMINNKDFVFQIPQEKPEGIKKVENIKNTVIVLS